MTGAGVVAILLLVTAPPLLTSNQFLLHLGITVLLWTLLGAAWNLLGGFAGQVSFGHATFFGVGAYTTMILYLKVGLPPWYGMLVGGLVSVVVSLPIGLICFRLRGPYFSLSTLAVAEIVRLVAQNWEGLTNGPVGLLITTLPRVAWGTRAINWESKAPFYYIIAALALVSMLATYRLSRARLGAYLLAIREDEEAAESVGIDTVRAKVTTLAPSSPGWAAASMASTSATSTRTPSFPSRSRSRWCSSPWSAASPPSSARSSAPSSSPRSASFSASASSSVI